MKCPKCGSEEIWFEGRTNDDRQARVGQPVAYYVNYCHSCGYSEGHEEPVKEAKA